MPGKEAPTTPKRRRASSRSCSPSRPAAKRLHSEIPDTALSGPGGVRAMSEWKLLHDRSVMALSPTPSMVTAISGGPLSTLSSASQLTVRVAAFDLDGTLLKYSRGKSGADAGGEWEWLHSSVPHHLKALSANGFLIAIFSNQSTINGFKGGWNANKAASIQRKIVSMSSALDLPLIAYVSTKYDRWRKPLVGLWGQLQEDIAAAATLADGCALDCNTHSFYVGDAAGRPAGPGRPKKDFSCGDRRFAHNLSLPFYTEEEFFKGFPESGELIAQGTGALSSAFCAAVAAARQASPPFDWDGVSPEELRAIPSTYEGLSATKVTATDEATPVRLPMQAPFFAREDHRQEMIILVGPPSCGKSTLYRRHFQTMGYAHVNRDALGTKERCLKAAEQLWVEGRSVVIDNTNPAPEDRRAYCDLVKRLTQATAAPPLPIRFIELECSRALAMHLNGMRARLGQAAAVPLIAYHTFFARYKPVLPAELQATKAESALRLPPVVSFEGQPPQTKREFLLLS